jgi:leucyl-tRNA synthetase
MSESNILTDYDFNQIEKKWQKTWVETKPFAARLNKALPKCYVADMFPYPSGAGLHLGHCENYAITDIYARYKRACGYNVIFPIGWDAFGLPTENYAVKTGRHPAEVTHDNIATFIRQLRAYGMSYDFDRQVNTTDPLYYKWTQWIWLQLFKRGLAYVEEKPVWWCPALGTVLANEEVIDGKSEVGHHPVERRPLRQWVLRITAYADRLLAGLKDLNWPDSTKKMQEAWIGRSEGAEVIFDLEGHPGEKLTVYTTRPDTLFGVTFMVVAPEHPLVAKITTAEHKSEVEAYVKAAASKSDLDRTELAKEKTGVFTGAYAINPVNGTRAQVWVGDYVLGSYGTGAIIAVPAHDERDYTFAQKHGIEIIPVIANPDGSPAKLPYTEAGVMVNSGAYNGMPSEEFKKRIVEDQARLGRARATVNYKLRDWLFSRQRYWGEPFPIVWVSQADYQGLSPDVAKALDLPKDPVTCVIDGQTRCALPVPEKALPLRLPDVEHYQPTGTGESPLAAVTDWLEIWYNPATGEALPATKAQPAGFIRARRETNTMPQWAGSCWYYLRYLEPHNDAAIASPEALAYWGTPDLYVGGAEHAVLHLLYARFWHMVLFDIGAVPMAEPFKRLFHQGIILGEDGEKMSKSRGNVANPDDVIAEYGADTLRMYLMFLGPLESMKPWSPKGIEGVHRFLRRTFREVVGEDGKLSARLTDGAEPNAETDKLLHATVKKVSADIEGLHYNTAISALMILLNQIQAAPTVAKSTLKTFVQLLAPFAPHLGEELWQRLGGAGSVGVAEWPTADESKLVATSVKMVVQVNGKLRGEMELPVDATEVDAVRVASALEKVQPFLAGKTIRKTIFVKGRLLNLVVG